MKHKRILAAVCAAIICWGLTGTYPLAAETSDVLAAESALSTRNSHIDLTGVHT